MRHDLVNKTCYQFNLVSYSFKLLVHTNKKSSVMYLKVKLFFKTTLWCFSVGHFGSPLSPPLLLMWKWYEQWSFHNPIPLSTSLSSYWEVWRSLVWPWTFCSCSSIPFVCAAGGAKMRNSPTLTAAAQPGVSSLQHSSAGESKHIGLVFRSPSIVTFWNFSVNPKKS